jgi:hypothetical protein
LFVWQCSWLQFSYSGDSFTVSHGRAKRYIAIDVIAV